MYELVVIGAGPAGMTVVVYAARKRLNTLLISYDLGGQPLTTAGVENYMGYQFIEGPELMQKFEEQVRQSPSDVKTEIGQRVESVSRINRGFEVRTDKGETYQAKAVIFATGKRPRQLNAPGEKELVGKGVTYCAICDGPLFAGEKVAVIGGGNSALEAADDMIKIAEHVYLISLTSLTGDRILIDKITNADNLTMFLEHEVLEIKGEDRVEGIKIRDLKSKQEKEFDVGGVFIEIGLVPNSGAMKGVTTLNRLGEIEVNCANETGVPGLFAAGDVTTVPEKQIIVAAGEGAKAALQAHRYLQRLKQ
ncbi:MAG: thioredoxin-disulfide reductase [Chloroflexi bacterium CG_4_10_14_0_8_um_filter_46_9]|nr:MAG: thioredoxin-disulfide reductase [Dehalococcoidia bacterium CG2_30_46_19]PIW40190.1 MAG: thioredoxin-disulfide reductase [Chloroflexi bacterium CG15_BIG_FIL_POST_REV_8_21_14_020_46_15]PIZ26895.1 MAG: thioredoxin-disulfide reductase [Chloroflexi bacterium CG_4_10_14_0_8_um_filter_46_9]